MTSYFQKLLLLVSAVLVACRADVSHLSAGNSLDGYYYPKPAIPFESQGYVYSVPEVKLELPKPTKGSGYYYEKPNNPLVYPKQKPQQLQPVRNTK